MLDGFVYYIITSILTSMSS